MKNGTLTGVAPMGGGRTRMSESSLRRKLNSIGVGPGVAFSLPLVETMKRVSLPSRAMSEMVRPENGL